ncbi:MAG: HAMP domain-containing protein [Spirochaetales bacterium]|nr:HAMP domain-containing protein [Spirochaetales bacterium]
MGGINLRIAALFSAFLGFTALLLLAGVYSTLKSSLDQEDLQFIQHKLAGYWAQSQTRNIDSFIGSLGGGSVELEGKPYFLRVADGENRTIFFMFPQGWKDFFPEDSFEDALRPSGEVMRISSARRPYTLLAAGIRLEGDYILQIGISTEDTDKLTAYIVRTFAALLLPLLLVSLVGGSFLTAKMLAPIAKLAGTVTSIVNTGSLTARIQESRGQGELADLVSLFNRMLEHIETLVKGMKGALDAVAHDLRTPLTRFRGMAELALAGQEDPERLREALEDGLEEADRIITQLNAIMDLSEAETGTLSLKAEETDAAHLVTQLIEMYSYIAEEKNVRIRFEGPQNLPAVLDTARWRRVVGNLLDNAVKYSPEGKTVFVQLSEKTPGFSLTIRDEGPGIPQEELPRIWERLYRGETAREKPGLGIGLAIAKAITEAQGGSIGAENFPAGGTVFRVNFPA